MQNERQYAGFFRRLTAATLDTLFLALPLGLVLDVFYSFIWTSNPADLSLEEIQRLAAPENAEEATHVLQNILLAQDALMPWLTQNLIGTLVMAAVVVGCWMLFSATPGKMMVGIKIVDATTGEAPSRRQDIIRYLGYFISTLGLGLGFFAIITDPKKQGWHDKIAGTVVVYKENT